MIAADDIADMRERADGWLTGWHVTITRDNAFGGQHLALDVRELLDEVEQLRAIAENAACWLESNSDKSARRFHAARIRHEIGEPA